MLTYFLIFLAMFVLDIIWAIYAVCMARKHQILGCTMAATMPFFNAFFTKAYVTDFYTAIPAAAGAFLGTWVGLMIMEKFK